MKFPEAGAGSRRQHMTDICRQMTEMGVPREKLLTHGAGWKNGELLYGAALNEYSCPGWSFYRHAADPGRDVGVQEALKRSDAPAWGAVEWMLEKDRTAEGWRKALGRTLSDPRCVILGIFNWEGIRDSDEIMTALRQIIDGSVPKAG